MKGMSLFKYFQEYNRIEIHHFFSVYFNKNNKEYSINSPYGSIKGVNDFLNALGVGEISCFKNKCILSETRVMPQVIKPL